MVVAVLMLQENEDAKEANKESPKKEPKGKDQQAASKGSKTDKAEAADEDAQLFLILRSTAVRAGERVLCRQGTCLPSINL